MTINDKREDPERGLHASVRPLDALRYAPGAVVCRVEVGGDHLSVVDRTEARRWYEEGGLEVNDDATCQRCGDPCSTYPDLCDGCAKELRP